jgi:acyl carrier protein
MIEVSQFIEDFKEILVEVEDISLKTNLKDLDSYDSLFVLEIIQFFDEKYSINIDVEIIQNSVTLEDLYKRSFNIN